MVEVFKTNVTTKKAAMIIVADLARKFPGSEVNFDLDDCDRILRIEAGKIFRDEVISMLRKSGYLCEPLE